MNKSELIDALAERAPTQDLRNRLASLRDEGFDFDNIKQNLDKAGAGKKTRTER